MNGEIIKMAQILIVGGIILWAVVHRYNTWNKPQFFLAIRVNAAIFVAFGLGSVVYIYYGVFDINVDAKMFFKTYYIYPPLALIAYNFMLGNGMKVPISKLVAVIVVWAIFANYAQMNAFGPNSISIMLCISAICACLVLGVVNGILGPLLPGLAISIFVAKVFNSGFDGTLPIVAVVELATDFFPQNLRGFVSVILIVFGLADGLNFFGVREFLERTFRLYQD
ncbi:MAG: hypothetical protein HQL42_06115 [Alphaproteobacteria bacterium]|nr:hypothetical protein [Alphaproteobacteria bacterium]